MRLRASHLTSLSLSFLFWRMKTTPHTENYRENGVRSCISSLTWGTSAVNGGCYFVALDFINDQTCTLPEPGPHSQRLVNRVTEGVQMAASGITLSINEEDISHACRGPSNHHFQGL